MIAECDLQQEKIRELRVDVAKKVDALAEEWTKVVKSAKQLEETARERMMLTRQHYEETK